jgi:hypothetical protein
MELGSKPGGLPNLFYDAIVFLIPTLLFGLGFLFGMGWEPKVIAFVSSGKLEGWHSVWLMIAVVLASYEYGRVAETFSDTFVGAPLRFLHKRKLLLKHKDFVRDLRDDTITLNLSTGKVGSRHGSKWAIYLFALGFAPGLGADLLKRYAWEKLARSSAFSCILLAAISLCFAFKARFVDRSLVLTDWHFGSNEYTGVALVSYVLLCADYYKRNAWNHDLLVTAVPILARAAELLAKPQKKNGEEHPPE